MTVLGRGWPNTAVSLTCPKQLDAEAPGLKIRLERHHEVAWFTVEITEPFGADGGVIALVEQIVAVQCHRPGVVDAIANTPVPHGITRLADVVAADRGYAVVAALSVNPGADGHALQRARQCVIGPYA